MSDDIDHNRRRLLGGCNNQDIHSCGIFELVRPMSKAEWLAGPASLSGPLKSFGPLKQIDAGVLNIGYADVGPAHGPVVILLHGWPYDIHSFVDVAVARRQGLSRDRPVSARIWLNALSVRRDVPQR